MHKHCLSCNECKSSLDASTFYNGFDGEVYCKYCYAVKFGHKQKSNYKGWMDVKAILGEKGDRATCPRCSGKVSCCCCLYFKNPVHLSLTNQVFIFLYTVKSLIEAAATIFFKPFLMRLLFKSGYYLRAATNDKFHKSSL